MSFKLRMDNLLLYQQRMPQLSSHQPILWPGWWTLRDSSMETSGRTIAKPSSTTDSPSGASWGDSGWKRTRYWHWIAKLHSKWMISLSPDSCFFCYKKKAKFIHVRWLVFSNSNLLMFWLPAFVAKFLYILQNSTSELSQRLSPGLEPPKVCWIKEFST